jgi:alkylation response protein AidB-like acyl-CoA dehydrogenase
MSHLLDRRDIDFLLYKWLRIDDLFARPRYASHSKETCDAVIQLSERLATDAFLPAFKKSDQHEPRLVDGSVLVLPEIKNALRLYADAGLFAGPFDEIVGGLQLPQTLHYASIGYFMAASIATAAYSMLTIANARLIASFGTAAQIRLFAKPQIEGLALGTMCLSEPHAGSSLAEIRTVARPDGEDELGFRYRLFGNKMWISGGDHDITGNIVHLVLAKTPGSDGTPLPGVNGISLFIVPKRLDDNAVNDVAIAGLNHKMGYRGTSNCLLNLGEGAHRPRGSPGAIGWRVGAVGAGLMQMFQMMNEARISVGLGAAVLGYRGYLHSVDYARGRIQGHIAAHDGVPSKLTAIIEHPDVRRMLLAQKAYAEGALALVLYAARLMDDQLSAGNESAARAGRLLDLLTPVVKSWPSEYGVAANDLAIQIHGGYGYTRDYDVEQLYRDNRLNAIHEGTTGIQGLDLLGRKVLRDRGAAIRELRETVDVTLHQAHEQPSMTAYARQLERAWVRLASTVSSLTGEDRTGVLDHATQFLWAFGHIVVAWLWLDMACICAGDTTFDRGKRMAARYFFEHELPKIGAWLDLVEGRSDLLRSAPTDCF